MAWMGGLLPGTPNGQGMKKTYGCPKEPVVMWGFYFFSLP